MQRILMLTIPTLMLFSAAGCVNEIDREVDCVTICQTYQDCLPGDQDEDACRDRCDNATTGEVDECDACLDTSDACTDCTFECAGPLAG